VGQSVALTLTGRVRRTCDNAAIFQRNTQGVTMRGNVAAVVLVLVGSFFLLSNLGVIDISLTQLIKTWWPVVLIAVGISLFFTPDKQKKD
jgi:hypothetical protein